MSFDENDQLKTGRLSEDPESNAEAINGLNKFAPPIKSFLDKAVSRLRDRAEGRDPAIETPWKGLNHKLEGGLRAGVHTFVGNTGVAKTQFALQVSHHAALNGIPVAYVGLELKELDLTARLVGIITKRPWSHIFLGKEDSILMPANLEEEQLLEKALTELRSLPFHADLRGPYRWSAEDILILAEAMRSEYPHHADSSGKIIRWQPILIVVDFLQIVGEPDDPNNPGRKLRMDLRERIGRCAYAASDVARRFDAAVVLVSSTARENYAKLNGEKISHAKVIPPGEGPPGRFIGMGKESGEIEFAADSVMVLCREPWTTDCPPEGGTRCFIAIAKMRAGTTAWAELRFNGSVFSERVEEKRWEGIEA